MAKVFLPALWIAEPKTPNLDAGQVIQCRDVAHRTSLTVPVPETDSRQDLILLIL